MKLNLIEIFYEENPYYFSFQVYEALERFAEIMGLRGVELNSIDEAIFFAIHLALTFIHIKDLIQELKELTFEMKNSKETIKVGDK